MIDVTLTFNGYDFSPLLSTYKVTHEIEVSRSLTAMDGTEYFATRKRPVVRFSLMPLSDAQTQEVYEALSPIVGEAEYTDPHRGDVIGTMRVTSNLEAAFGLRSVDGNRYYKGSTIVLRQRTVL